MGKNTSDIVKNIKQRLPFDKLFRELYPDRFRQKGNSLCPFHEDRNESFSVKKTYGRCHAGCMPPGNGERKSYDIISLWQAFNGCDFPTALKALAGRCGVEFPASKGNVQQDLGEPTAIYVYEDESRQPLFRVCRYMSSEEDGHRRKTFRQQAADGNGGWHKTLNGCRLVLFGLPELLKAAPDEPILLVEGEKDVLTARELRFIATTNPMGAGKWPKQCKDHNIHLPLKDRTCWIIPDNDELGRVHADEIARSLRRFAASVKVVTLPNPAPKADLSDFVETIGNNDLARELLTDQADKTAEYRPAWTGPSIVTFSDLMSQDLPEPRWIIRDLLPEGLCVLAGAPKIGKSWLAHGLSIGVATGRPALGRFLTSQGYVLHLALEDNPRRFRKRMAMMLGQEPAPDMAFFASQWPYFSEDSKKPDGLHHVQRWIEHHLGEVRLIVLDTLQKVRQRRRGKDDVYGRDYRDLEGLQKLAGQYGIAILVIHHQNKGEFKDIFNTVSGSTGLTGAADTIWILDKAHRLDTEATLFVSGRDIEESKGALRFDRETGLWTWQGDAVELALTAERRAIREALRTEGRPLSPKEIAEAVGNKDTNVRQLLSKMAEAGEVERSAGQPGKYVLPPEDGLYGQFWSHEERKKDYEEEQPDCL